MSGGSYNYASDAADLSDLLRHREDLDRLAVRIKEVSGGRAIALETLLGQADRLDRLVTKVLDDLYEVMHAVEWHDSGDWGEDQMQEAIAKYLADWWIQRP